jgi:hypothetical protein
MRKLLFALATVALIASGAFASAATVNSADHRDSPLNISNPTADINDVYAFRSLENNNNLVVAVSVNPLIVPSDNNTRGNFDPAVQYQLHIDKNGDLADDITVNIRMTTQSNNLVIEGMTAQPIVAAITAPGATTPVVTNAGGIKVFAGLRDDPFFFDLAGFQAFRQPAGPGPRSATCFGGRSRGCLRGHERPRYRHRGADHRYYWRGQLEHRDDQGLGLDDQERQPHRPHGDPGDQHRPDPVRAEGCLQSGQPGYGRGSVRGGRDDDHHGPPRRGRQPV